MAKSHTDTRGFHHGTDYVNKVRFHQDGNTTNHDGEGNSAHQGEHGASVVNTVAPNAPGGGSLHKHGGGESAHDSHHSKHSSAPHVSTTDGPHIDGFKHHKG